MRGRLITLEGIEGVGKTTQLNVVRDHLLAQGLECVMTREPGGTAVGERLRELLLAQDLPAMNVVTELLLMYAARAEHLDKVILPALMRGAWVVCDRFYDASFAYQGGGRGVANSTIDTLTQLVVGTHVPALTLLLDAPVAIGFERVATRRGTMDRFEAEKSAFFERVRQVYLERAAREPARIKVIDASRPLNVVSADIIAVLSALMAEQE